MSLDTAATAEPPPHGTIRSCTCCGLAHRITPLPPRTRACCTRCGTTLARASAAQQAARTVAIALAALVVYPVAVTLPIVRIEQFGHMHESSILSGISTLLSTGHVIVGLIVLLCSIVLPLGKLAALLILSLGGSLLAGNHRAVTYRVVEFTGRWGMLDVLLVAVLVAALKVGDFVHVTAGPGALAFATVVVLSLIATASFDPHTLWQGPEPAAATEDAP